MTAPFLDPNLPGTSSAIAALLHSLTSPAPAPLGGQPQGPPPMGAGPAAPMPAPDAPPQPGGPPQPSGGITGRIQSLLSHIDPRPQAPPGYEGLLSPEDIQKARPGILASLIGAPGGPSAREQYENNLNHVVQLHGLATQIAENRRILANRQRIASQYQLPPNASLDDVRNNLAQQISAYTAAGDTEMVKELGQSFRGILQAPKDNPTQLLQPGGELVDPKTGKVIVANPAQPKDQTPQLFVDPAGNSHYVTPGQDVPAGYKPWSAELAMMKAAQSAAQFASKDADGYAKAFNAQIKPLRDRAAVIDQAIKTIGDAADTRDPNKQKALYSSAIANFIQAADQKAQIRWQLLNYYKENVDPSIGGKWNVLRARLLQGTLPQYTMQAMLSHLQGLRTQLFTQIETQRKGWASRKPGAADMLPPTSEFFPETGGVEVPSAAPRGDLYSKYGLTPKP